MDSNYQILDVTMKDSETAEQIIKRFRPKIIKELYATDAKEREDLYQELSCSLIKCIQEYEDYAPGFWSMQKKYNSQDTNQPSRVASG